MSATTRVSIDAAAARRRSKGRDVLSWSGFEAGLLVIYGVVSTPIVALLLGPRELGKAGAVMAIIGLFEIVCAIGLQEAVIRSASAHTRLTDSVNTALLALAALGMAIIYLLSGPIAALFGDPEIAPLLVLASPLLLLNAAILVPIAMLTRKFRARTLSLRNMLARTAIFVITVALALGGLGAASIIIGALTGSLASLLLIFAKLRRRGSLRFDWQEVKPLFAFGSAVGAEALVTTGAIRLFSLLIGYFHGMTALGYFQLGQRIVDEVANIIQMMIMRYGLAYFAAFERSGRNATSALLDGTALLSYASLPFFCGLAVCAQDLVLLVFGHEWVPATPILQMCAVAWVVAFPTLLIPPLLRAKGEQRKLVGYAAASAAISLVCLVATQSAPLWLVGTAWAARHAFALPLAVFAAGALLAVRPATFLGHIWKPYAAALLMTGAVMLFQAIDFNLPVAVRLMLSVGLGAAVYAVAVWLLDRQRVSATIDLLRRKSPEVEMLGA